MSSDLYSAIAALLPLVKYVPLSIESLNKAKFAPGVYNGEEETVVTSSSNSMDPTAIVTKKLKPLGLMSGVLQATSNTWFILDELPMTSGELQSQGVHNVRNLKNLVLNATVPLVMTSTGVAEQMKDVEVDFGVLVLSESKCMLSGMDFVVPLRPMKENKEDENVKESKEDVPLELIRGLLDVVKYDVKYTVSEEMREVGGTCFFKSTCDYNC
jgi:hypothetical protein